jgi:hypothetical protein
MEENNIDEILGITRCVRCGHRLEGEVECPFCAIVLESPRKKDKPKWMYITAYFLTSPLSLYAILKTKRLNLFEKILAFSGCLIWLSLYILLFK